MAINNNINNYNSKKELRIEKMVQDNHSTPISPCGFCLIADSNIRRLIW